MTKLAGHKSPKSEVEAVALNLLATLKSELHELSRVARFVKLLAFAAGRGVDDGPIALLHVDRRR